MGRRQMKFSEKKKGFLLVWFGIIIYSFETLLVSEANVSGILSGFWRGFYVFLVLVIIFPLKYRKNTVAELKKGHGGVLISGLLWGISGICYNISVHKAGSSISLICLSLVPIMSIILEAIFLNEKCDKIDLLAIAVSIFGIYYMFHNGIGTLKASSLIYPFIVPLIMAINYTYLRKEKEVSRMGSSMTGGIIAAILGAVLLKGQVRVSSNTMIYLMILGLIVIPLGQIMMGTGTKYLKASQVTLIGSLESVWGLLAVWIFLRTAPSKDQLIGGIIVFIAVSANLLRQVITEK